MRLGLGRESDVLFGRQALRSYFVTLDQPKMRLG